jgi:hypothetical protein
MKQLLEKLAASPEQERLAAARRAVEECSKPMEAGARKRGGLVSRCQTLHAELVSISATMGPHGVYDDPADSDESIRPRRVALKKEIADLDRQIANEDAIRRELEPEMAEAHNDLTWAEYLATEALVKEAMQTMASTQLAARQGLQKAREVIESAQRKYQSHQFLSGNRTLRAHAGAPPILIQIDLMLEGTRLTLEAVAIWDRTLLASDEPAAARAAAIERSEVHLAEAVAAGQRRQIEIGRSKQALPPPLPPRSDLEMIATLNAEADARSKVVH